jgi:beta-N-acetylhexosaminidase
MLQTMVAGSVSIGLAACAGPILSPTSQAPPPPTPSPTPIPSAAPSPGPTPAESVSPSPSDDPAELRRKAMRLVMVGFRGVSIGPRDPITKALEAGLGGVILFDRDYARPIRNVRSPTQLLALTASLRAVASANLFVAIDQEGGRVSRLNPAQGFPAGRSQAEVGVTGDPDEAREAGREIGATMASVGIDLDLAPVVDVNVNPTNPAIGALGRSFSSDPAVVAAMAEAEIRGLHEHAIRATIKHFPGLGSATANSDFDHVDVTRTWTDAELDPYRALIAAGLPDAIMSGHIVNDTLDPGVPASLSAATIDRLLRGQLGWTGVVVTDDLGAQAIVGRYERHEAIALAIEAGNDLLLFANQTAYVADLATEVTDSIVGHVTSGRIAEARIDASIERLDRLAVGTAIE